MTVTQQTEVVPIAAAKPRGGPRTPEGKAISSQNALETGMYANARIIRGEKLADFENLRAEYYTSHQPQTPDERDQLDLIVDLVWRVRRYGNVETELWNNEM